MFKSLRRLLAAALAATAWLAHGSAGATVLVTGAGTWDPGTLVSSFSAPGAGWSFSFLLPDVIAANPTTQVSSFSYTLAGAAVGMAPASVQFYAPADSGGFDIHFVGGDTFSLYGQALLSGQSLALGSFDVFTGLDGSVPVGSGTLTLVAVPEPASALGLLLGLGVLVAARRRRPV